MKIILATSNKDKVREVKEFLENERNIKILTSKDFNIDKFEVNEDGQSLKENSYKKAKALFDIVKTPTLADDTGLFVKSLDNKPGVHSHRYANENPSYKENRDKLLDELREKKDRSAYFKTVICFIDSKGEDYYFEGKVDGEICKEEIGDKDFGYDQIFKVKGENKTFGQMSEKEKNSFSHRTLALDEFRKFLGKINENSNN